MLTLLTPLVCSSCSGVRYGPYPRERWLHGDESDRIQRSLERLYDGMVAGDAAAIRATIHATNDPDGALVDAQVRRILANVRFVKALSRFDFPHGANPFSDDHVFLGDDVAFGLPGLGWEVRGSEATLPADARMGGANQPPPPPLIKVRGVWKVNLTPDPVAATKPLAVAIHRYAVVLERATADIESGKLRTIADVQNGLSSAPRFARLDYLPDLVLLPPEAGLQKARPDRSDQSK